METRFLFHISTLILLFRSILPAAAQIDMRLLSSTTNCHVTFTVKDKTTDEPIAFATAYLIPQGDTTIVDFTLADKNGKVTFSEVPSGNYDVNVEMLGYKPYKTAHKFRNWRENLGEILLDISTESLQSSRITAAGNPIRVIKDTIEFNASSFRTGQNDMLEDLLKKMPGMEIENGKVKLNGEAIDRITVGGKTFFFNDQSAALKNLPAYVIDKIKVIDKKKDEAAFSGITTKDDKEKVMDVGLKKEYRKGWFGNLKAAAGANISSRKDNDLKEKTGVVYNASGLASGYNDKDQVVFIGNGQNISDGNSSFAVFSSYGEGQSISNPYTNLQGLTSSASGGVNYNTQRAKNLDISTAVKYDHSDKRGKKESYRTSFVEEGDELNTTSSSDSRGHQDGVNVSLQVRNTNKQKYYVDFTPSFSYHRNGIATSSLSETSSSGTLLNSNQTTTSGTTSLLNNGMRLSAGLRNLGKERRSISASISYRYGKGDGQSKEVSILKNKVKDLSYLSGSNALSMSGYLSYSEPIAKKWQFQASFKSLYSKKDEVKDAFNADGNRNDFYSTFTGNTYLKESGALMFQFNEQNLYLQAGAEIQANKNIIRTRTRGQETLSGKEKWETRISPGINFYYDREKHQANVYYSMFPGIVPSGQISPTLDLSNPLQISTGNVYLKPDFNHSLYASYSYNNRKTFTYLGVNFNGTIVSNMISSASWFDTDGIRYNVPVNARRPQSRLSANLNLNQPFGKQRHFSIGATLAISYSDYTSYQAKGTLDGLDTEEFDYGAFMDSFWGNAGGDRFYNGESGFSESHTRTLTARANLGFKYTSDIVDATIRGNLNNHTSRYSLDPRADKKTWDYSIRGELKVNPGKEWEIGTTLRYLFYRGYPEGYGAPQWLWNLNLNKNIRSFTLSLRAVDLLNQTRNFSHRASDEYIEDTYVNAFGRYITFGLTWHFGKKNAKQNRNVQDAILRMK